MQNMKPQKNNDDNYRKRKKILLLLLFLFLMLVGTAVFLKLFYTRHLWGAMWVQKQYKHQVHFWQYVHYIRLSPQYCA